MQDGIILGNGNSRYMKTVADALSQYPTYQDFMAALIAGTFPFDLNGINPAGWDTIGTAMTKANVLTDETAVSLGLDPATATPDGAFAKLVGKSLPPGTILWHGSTAVPSGFLLCDGSFINTEDYADLFSVIGTTFGGGGNQFQLPDMRSAFVRGAGTGVHVATFGIKQGATTIQVNTFKNVLAVANADKTTSATVTEDRWTKSASGNGSATTYSVRPYNIALTPIIKY